MAHLGISEFTFGYAFLYEQTHRKWGELTAAPVLPSLRAEKDDAWDAKLPLYGGSFYYQFKLADYLERGNASFIKKGPYSSPYYRIALHRRNGNEQHKRLRAHSQTFPNTYYVAPEFSTVSAFNNAFLAGQITEDSRMIPLGACIDINDDDQHYITFQQGIPSFTQHSSPTPLHGSFFGRDIERLYLGSSHSWVSIDDDFARELFAKVVSNTERLLDDDAGRTSLTLTRLLAFDPQSQKRDAILLRVSQILSVFYGLTLVIVGPSAGDSAG